MAQIFRSVAPDRMRRFVVDLIEERNVAEVEYHASSAAGIELVVISDRSKVRGPKTSPRSDDSDDDESQHSEVASLTGGVRLRSLLGAQLELSKAR